MKRIPIILLILLLFVFIAVGCDLPKVSNDSPSAPKVTLWAYASSNIEEWNARKADIDAKFNINLDVVSVAEGDFVQKLQTAINNGAGYPDIIEWRVESNRILNADPAKALVLPLDGYVASSTVFPHVIQSRVAWLKYGGHTYGLPHDVHPVVLIYNDTLWKSVGVDVATLQSWGQFFTEAQKLTGSETVDGHPVHYALPSQDVGLSDTMFMIWQQTGSQILDSAGNPTFETPGFKDFVNQWFQWRMSGPFGPWDWGGFGTLLQNGTIASYLAPDWWVSQVYAAANQGTYQFKVRRMPSYQLVDPQSAAWGGTFLAICKLAKGPYQLYKIIEYMQYDEASLVNYRYGQSGLIPPMSTVWNNSVFNQPNYHFGGQQLGTLQIQVAQQLPQINTGDIFWDAVYEFGKVYQQMKEGTISVDDGLHTVQVNAENLVQ